MYHIGFAFGKQSLAKRKRINEALNNAAVDWVRYSFSTWIAYAENPEALHIHIREAIDDTDQFLVIPLDMNATRQGLLSPWIWEWLRVDRTKPNWQSIVENLDYPRPAPPPTPQSSLEDIFKALYALQPPKDDSK